jgi:hypothetical protein
MITITRSLARQLRAVFRRAGIKPRDYLAPPISFHAGPNGLRIRAMTVDVAVEHHLPGEYPAEEFTVALELLDDCQGKRDDPVTLEARNKKKVVAGWRDGGIPQLVEYDSEPAKKPFPELPKTFAAVDSAFWPALRDAAEAVDQNPTRFALNNIQLRGESGQVFATDGKQIFAHCGFQFPWTGDVLVPALAVLGCADLAGAGAVEIGKTEQSLTLRIGNWTLVLTIDKLGRFPKMEEVVARAESGGSLVRLTPSDGEFLANALPRLPREDQSSTGVTLDLSGQAFVRARAGKDAPVTELLLSGAEVTGEPIRIETDRQYMLRALKLGFTQLRLTSPDSPVLATDGRRKYIWALLSPKDALGPTDDAIRIASASAGGENSAPQTKSPRRRFTMSENSTTTAVSDNGTGTAPMSTEPTSNGQPSTSDVLATNGQAQANGQVRRARVRKAGRQASAGPIDQAIALRGALQESVNKTNELIRTLKRQRQQSRLVQSTLASLKQLQQAG